MQLVMPLGVPCTDVGGRSGLEDTGHQSLPSSQHGINGSPPVGSTCLQRASGDWGKPWDGGRLQTSSWWRTNRGHK